MEDKLKTTVAFITGGASGIGKATAARIIKHGGRVVIVDLNQEGQKVAKTLGAKAIFVSGDVTSEESMIRALDLAKKAFGGINVVINAAGIAALQKPYDFETGKPHSIELYQRIMNINVFGTFNVTRLAVGLLADNKPDENEQRGLIINLASVLSFDAPANAVAYATAKAAVAGMTLPLARSFGPKGIRVVAVAPGFVDTPMAAGIKTESERIFADIDILNLSPKRIGQPDEIAHVMQCIIENPYLNAQVVRVDGGYRYVPRIPSL